MVAQYYPPAKDRRQHWTPDQDSLLLLHYGSMDLEALARLVNKTPGSVRARVSRLRIGCAATGFIPYRNNKPVVPSRVRRLLERDRYPVVAAWEPMDDFRVRLFYGERSIPELAAALGRTPNAVKSRLGTLHWSLDKAIAFRLEVIRSPLWLEALETLQSAEADARRRQRAEIRSQLLGITQLADLHEVIKALEDPQA